MIGTITGLIIAAGISAGAGIASAKMASSSAKSAAKTQTDAATRAAELEYQAAREALDLARQQWETTQAQQAPWLQAGTGAVNMLAYLMGVPMAPTAQAPATTATAPATVPLPAYSRGRGNALATGFAVPRSTVRTRQDLGMVPLATVAGGRARPGVTLGAATPRQPAGTTTAAAAMGTVRMRAPTGEERDVPVELVEHYLSRGAQVVTQD